MRTSSIKIRLVVWYAGWLTLVFVVFGVFVYAGLRHYLERELKDTVARRAERLAEILEHSLNSSRDAGREIQTLFAPEVNNRFIRVTLDGALLYLSGPPVDGSFDPHEVPAATNATGSDFLEIRPLPDGQTMFVHSLRRNDPGRRYLVEFGASHSPIEAALSEWRIALICALTLLIVVAVVGGYLLVGRALRPVGAIVRSAERISSRNLSERLPVPNTRDELMRLSTTLNTMIARLAENQTRTRRFFADASHELRTPLTIIQGELDSISERVRAHPEVKQLAESALEEVARLRLIVDGLFALSRVDAGEVQLRFVEVDLGELARTTTEQMCLLAEDKKLTVRCHAARNILVRGDRAQLKQVIVNLLDNAIKYTPEGGRIEVHVAGTRSALLEVTDTGIGIPEDALTRVFERFYRVDAARSRESGGAGLGLAIVESICLAHGGRVSAENRPGGGSRFVVELPLLAPSE